MLTNAVANDLFPEVNRFTLEDILKSYYEVAHKRLEDVVYKKHHSKPIEYPIEISENNTVWFEMTTKYFEMRGRPATFTLARNTANAVKHFSYATMMQRYLMTHQKWVQEGFYIKPIHFSSKHACGTFYFTYKHLSGVQFGMLGEFDGKNIFESVMISAIEGYFRESAKETVHIEQLVENLTERLNLLDTQSSIGYFIWKMSLDQSHLQIATAGMPEFLVFGKVASQTLIKNINLPYKDGRPNPVDIYEIKCQGADAILLRTKRFELPTFEQRQYAFYERAKRIAEFMTERQSTVEFEQVDSCALLFDLSRFEQRQEYIFMGLNQYEDQVNQMIQSIPDRFDHFGLRLIIMEFLTNAYKHGNEKDDDLPIKIIVTIHLESMYIEVNDMRIKSGKFRMVDEIDGDKLLEENGRGLFLVNAYSEEVYTDGVCIVSKIAPKED